MKTQTFFLLILIAPFLYGEEIATQRTAEESAQKYLTAFFHGDLETAAELSHPETLENLKEAYLQQVATGAIPEKEFRNQLGVPDDKELNSIDPNYLFIKLQELNRSGAPPGYHEAMKKTTVTVKSSERSAEGLVMVVLTVVTPTKNGESVQESPIYLKEHDGKFLVVMP